MARHSSPLGSTATRTLIALATATAALGAGAATADATPQGVPVNGGVGGDITVLRGAAGDPHGNGVDIPLSQLTGPVTQTGPVGAVPALEGVAGLLGGGASGLS
jgi:hypothetical protein